MAAVLTTSAPSTFILGAEVKLTVGVKKSGDIQAVQARLTDSYSKARLVVGVLKGATADVDDGKIQKRIPVAPYAAVHEYGAKNVPQRSFLRSTMMAKESEWRKAIYYALQRRGADHPAEALRDVGNLVRGDVVATIRRGDFAPLSPKTVKAKERKGRPEPSAPLIDTGSLIRSIGFEVRNK